MLYFNSNGLIWSCNATFKMSWSGYLSFTLVCVSNAMFFAWFFVFINNTPLLKYGPLFRCSFAKSSTYLPFGLFVSSRGAISGTAPSVYFDTSVLYSLEMSS